MMLMKLAHYKYSACQCDLSSISVALIGTAPGFCLELSMSVRLTWGYAAAA